MINPSDKEDKDVTVKSFIMLILHVAESKTDFQIDVCLTTDGGNWSEK
jgi:hypothetical protein